MYFLAILAMFKNESMIIGEWIEHYIWQGVNHIYLIDNDSNDDYLSIIQPYIDKGYITLYSLSEQHKQADHYNTIFKEIRNEMEWLMVCDIDEYWFGVNETISDYIKKVSNDVNSIRTYWTYFGSSGYIKQPKEIRKSFIKCTKFSEKKYNNIWNSKCIIKVSDVDTLIVHKHNFLVSENEIKENYKLRLFHYKIMSREYFSKIKMTRGDSIGYPNSDTCDTHRDLDYFNRWDFKEMVDTTLSNLVKKGYKK